MTLACDEHDVAGAGDADRFGDRFAAAGDLGCAGRASHDLAAAEEDGDQLQAQRFGMAEIHPWGKANPVISDRQGVTVVCVPLEVDPDWDSAAELIEQSYRMTAPRTLIARMEDGNDR